MNQQLLALFAAVAAANGAAINYVPLMTAGNYIPNQYLIKFNPQVSMAMVNEVAADIHAFRVLNIGDFKVVTGSFSDEVIERLRQRADLIEVIEHDQIVSVNANKTQTNPTWGLDRVDQVALPLDSKYNYPESAGKGVDAYIVDTGINLKHTDYTGRVINGYNFHSGTADADDDNGHGTHCAGTVGGTTYGVAKECTLIAVKVLGRFGSGSLANVAAGVNYAVTQHKAKTNARSVVSMSLGGGISTVIDQACQAAWKAGLTVVVASGNSNADACSSSPARVEEVITVNAATNTDARASFSNYGTCTDIFAPGVDITSAWIGSTTATSTISGTSMACPHVSGAAALLLGESNMTPDQVKTSILNRATANRVTDVKGSPNKLLYTL